MIYAVYLSPRTGNKREDRYRQCIVFADSTAELSDWITGRYGRKHFIDDLNTPREHYECIALDVDTSVDCGTVRQATREEWANVVNARAVARRLLGAR